MAAFLLDPKEKPKDELTAALGSDKLNLILKAPQHKGVYTQRINNLKQSLKKTGKGLSLGK